MGDAAVFGVHHHEVDFAVGDFDGVSVGIGKDDGVEDVAVFVAQVDGARGAVGLGLRTRCKVFRGDTAQLFFYGFGFVGCAFLSASCFLPFAM